MTEVRCQKAEDGIVFHGLRLSYDNRVIYEDHEFLIILFLAPLAHADEINVQQLNNIGNYYL